MDILKRYIHKIHELIKSLLSYTMLLFIFFFMVAYFFTKYGVFTRPFVNQYIHSVLEMLKIILLLLVVLALAYVLFGFFGKKYSLRVDNFNIAGINVFFDKSSEIYIKAVGSFLMSKRTLFQFNPKRDNISEVLDSYYSVYNYIRENLELLDKEENNKLFSLSLKILKVLNDFLTKHQNDYRRWYGKIEEENQIIISEDKKIIVHKTTIEEVQKHYYRYEEILDDFISINTFFNNNDFKEEFKLDTSHWRNVKDA